MSEPLYSYQPIDTFVDQRPNTRSNSTTSSSDYTSLESYDWHTAQNVQYPILDTYPQPFTQEENGSMSMPMSTPFSSLTTPFWSPIGTLDTVPLTPWSGQPVHNGLYIDKCNPQSAGVSTTSSMSSYFPVQTPTYPSPRGSVSSAYSNAHHPYQRPHDPSVTPVSATGGIKHVFHPSPPGMTPTLDVNLRQMHESLQGGFLMGAPMLRDAKPPRFRPTKMQLNILIAAYEENK